MDIKVVFGFFEGRAICRNQDDQFIFDDLITKLFYSTSCHLAHPTDLTKSTRATYEFLNQIRNSYEHLKEGTKSDWIDESDGIIHHLERLKGIEVAETIAKIKRAQTLYKQHHHTLTETSPAFLKTDKDYVLKAYHTDFSSLRWADISLRSDPEFMLKLYDMNNSALHYASKELKDNEAFMLEATLKHGFSFTYASERLKQSKPLIIAACKQYMRALQEAPDEFLDDDVFMLAAIGQNPHAIEYASKRLKDDDAFMQAAIILNHWAYEYASNRLKNDAAFMLRVMKFDTSVLDYTYYQHYMRALKEAPNEFVDNDVFMLAAIGQNPQAIEYASNRLKDDAAFMLSVIKLDTSALSYASERLKDDMDFMLRAMIKKPTVIMYASNRLKDDKDFLMRAIFEIMNIRAEVASGALLHLLKNPAYVVPEMVPIGSVLKYASNQVKDHAVFMMRVIQYDVLALEHVSDRLKDDEAFMLGAINEDFKALAYASNRLKDDVTFMMKAVIHNRLALEHTSNRLKDDASFMLKVISYHKEHSLRFASNRLKNDHAFMMNAIGISPPAAEYASYMLIDNKDFMTALISNNPNYFVYASDRLRKYPPFLVMILLQDNIDEAFLKIIPSYGFTPDDPIIKAILNYRNLTLKRYCIGTFFLLMISCHNSKGTWDEVIAPLFEKKQWAILPLMLLASMDLPKESRILPLPPSLDLKLLPHLFRSSINLAKGEDYFILPPVIDAFFKAHKESFKDAGSGALNTLLTLLKTLKSYTLGVDYLTHCLAIDSLSESLMRMRLLTILISKRTKAYIETLRDFSSNALLYDLLSEFIHEGLLDESSLEAFKKTFISSRHPEAIFTYASLFLHDEVIKPAIKRFIEMVVTGDFKNRRNEANSHSDELTGKQKRTWEAGAHLEARYEPIIQEFNPKEFFIAKLITDDHAPDQFPHLKSHLIGSPSIGAATEIEALCLQLMESPTLEEQLMLLRQLKEKLVGGGQFLRDIEDQIKLLERREKARDVTLYDSDNWQDLFYSGTEVLGSCQSIYAGPGTNKCLLGYALDGKTRILSVKNRGDEFGPMNARAIIKILITEEGKPALFLERVYPAGNPAVNKLIKDFALQRALALGMGLYEAGGGVKLSSEGCAAPWEYEDAKLGGAGTAVTTGSYIIHAKKVD